MKLLKTTKCKCGVRIENKHLKPGWLPIQAEKGFLGGKRVRFKSAVCDCGDTYTVLMLTEGNNFKIGDLIEIDKPEEYDKETMKDIQSFDLEAMSGEAPPEDLKTPTNEQMKFWASLNEMTRDELISLAKKLGVEGKLVTLKKDVLIEKIKETGNK